MFLIHVFELAERMPRVKHGKTSQQMCYIHLYPYCAFNIDIRSLSGSMAIFSIKMSTKDWVDPNQQRRKGLDEEIIGLEFKQVSLLCEWSVEWSVWWVQWHPNSLLGRRYLGQQVIICQKLLSTCYRVDMFFNIFTQTEFVVHIQRTKHVEMVKTHQSAALQFTAPVFWGWIREWDGTWWHLIACLVLAFMANRSQTARN